MTTDWIPLLEGAPSALEEPREALKQAGIAFELIRKPGASLNT